MTKRRLFVGGAALVLIALLVVVSVTPLRQAVLGPFRDQPPPETIRSLPHGFGGLNSSPISGDDWAGKGRLLPGIDFCSYFASSGLNDFVLFLWGDFNGGGGGTSTMRTNDGLKFHGYLLNDPAKRRVEFAGETKDGKGGRITIEDHAYDLSKGTLFLISARRDFAVKQLDRDMSRFRDADELYNELSKNDHDVMDFFGQAARPK